VIWLLVLLPALAGVLSFLLKHDGLRRGLLLGTSMVHLALTIVAWMQYDGLPVEGWMAIDAISLLFLGITSLLFLAASVYSVGTLRNEPASLRLEKQSDSPAGHGSEAVFTGCLLLFLSSMTLVTVSRHLGLVWVGIEATTLSSAPLIYYHKDQRSLEATWKYLLICSVGIALALLGNFFLAVSTSVTGGEQLRLTMDELGKHAGQLDPTWLKAAFLLLLVGYGTKMGLVPLHTWLPDAHSEAPAMVSALLSGALLNCALVGILRVMTVLSQAGLGEFARQQMLLFGIVSMIVASLFLISQVSFKRMLAYSSIEHMGVLALGIGLGEAGNFGALFHAVNHSLTKAALFLTAGSIITFYGTKQSGEVQGMWKSHPRTALLWLAGVLAILGSPPFGLFSSELMILRGSLSTGHWWIAAGYLASLAIAMAAISSRVFKMVFGAPGQSQSPETSSPWLYMPSAALMFLVLLLGVYMPRPLAELLQSASMEILGR
jgi:hydrogenase-4 component F